MANAPYTASSVFTPGSIKLPRVAYLTPMTATSVVPTCASPLKWYAANGITGDISTIPVIDDGMGAVTGGLTGTVTDNNVSVSGVVVRCYYRPTGQLIQTTTTNASGIFTFPYLDPNDTQNYFIVAFEPTSRDTGWDGNQYNAVIFDLLTPV